MSEKRYFKIEYDEEWYLFDSTTISEQLVREQAEYGYGVFANSLSPSEIMDLLNELAEDNELLKSIRESQQQMILKLYEENEQLRKKLECCKYEHFLNELDEIHEKVDKGDLSDFSPLKEDNQLKEKLYYWQCKYFKRDYEHKRDMCTRCSYYGGLLNYCLKDKCDKMVKRDYEVTVTHFGNGVSIGWKKGVDKR